MIKKEKLQFWRKISKVGEHKVIFAHPAKIWHTLLKFGTPCQILAHLANFGTPCEFDDFCLAKCSVFLHLATNSFGKGF